VTQERRPLPRGYVGEFVASFTELELAAALVGATLMQAGFVILLVLMAAPKPVEPEPTKAEAIPIQVKPVIDELPLLKLGGKQVRPKLPDMWKKNPPVRRVEAASAPSPQAADDPAKIPETPLVKKDAEAPKPEDEVVKEADELQPETSSSAEPTVEGEGDPGGVKEGTETDPLKARAIDQYRLKIMAWFNSRFSPPGEGAPCAELKALSASVAAVVGAERTVTSYTIARPSGNPVFDAKVKATMDAIVGQQLPPPPPLYPEILNATVFPTFSGKNAPCQ
jgi:outer membrane biosynthesis protein TonB